MEDLIRLVVQRFGVSPERAQEAIYALVQLIRQRRAEAGQPAARGEVATRGGMGDLLGGLLGGGQPQEAPSGGGDLMGLLGGLLGGGQPQEAPSGGGDLAGLLGGLLGGGQPQEAPSGGGDLAGLLGGLLGGAGAQPPSSTPTQPTHPTQAQPSHPTQPTPRPATERPKTTIRPKGSGPRRGQRVPRRDE